MFHNDVLYMTFENKKVNYLKYKKSVHPKKLYHYKHTLDKSLCYKLRL